MSLLNEYVCEKDSSQIGGATRGDGENQPNV
jgi:hypothetical protein